MSKLITMVGNIGSGKSTYVKQLVKEGYVVVSKDAIRYMLGAGKYIFNPILEDSIHCSITRLILKLAYNKVNMVIDETNMDRKTRKDCIDIGTSYGYSLEAIVMPKISREESVNRRLKSNHGYTPRAVWEEVFDRKEQAYQEPTIEEGFTEVTFLPSRNKGE